MAHAGVRAARSIAAAAAALALGYWLMPELEGYRALAVMALGGFVAGAPVASPWAVVLAPAALAAGYESWHALEASDAPRWSGDDTPLTLALMQLMFIGSAAAGAAAGWLAASGCVGRSRAPDGS